MTTPYQSFNFVVDIGVSTSGFVECTGLESETDVIEYREGSDADNSLRKLSGITRYSNIILKTGVTDSLELHHWRRTVTDGQTEKRDGVISLLGEEHQTVARWVFRRGWPCRLSGPEFNATESEVAIEELEICHEGLERVE